MAFTPNAEGNNAGNPSFAVAPQYPSEPMHQHAEDPYNTAFNVNIEVQHQGGGEVPPDPTNQTLIDKIAVAEDKVMRVTSINTMEHSRPRLFFRVSAVICLLMFILFMIWIVFTPYSTPPWFIYPTYVGFLVISILYAAGSTNAAGWKKKLYTIHKSFWLLTSAMLVLTNVYAGHFPWCVYPCGALMFFFAIHALALKFTQFFTLFIVHSILYVIVNAMLFITYCYGNTKFPWNLIVLVAWFVVLVLHYVFDLTLLPKLKQMIAARKNPAPAPQETSVPSAEAHNNFTIDGDVDAFYGAEAAVSYPKTAPASFQQTGENQM